MLPNYLEVMPRAVVKSRSQSSHVLVAALLQVSVNFMIVSLRLIEVHAFKAKGVIWTDGVQLNKMCRQVWVRHAKTGSIVAASSKARSPLYHDIQLAYCQETLRVQHCNIVSVATKEEQYGNEDASSSIDDCELDRCREARLRERRNTKA